MFNAIFINDDNFYMNEPENMFPSMLANLRGKSIHIRLLAVEEQHANDVLGNKNFSN